MSSAFKPAEQRIYQNVATLLGARDALAAINTNLVSDRAIVAVDANDSLYMLRKDSVADEASPNIIAPDQGGPGRWFRYGPGNNTVEVSVFHAAIGPQTSVDSAFSLADITGPTDIVVHNRVSSGFTAGVLEGDILTQGPGAATMRFLNATGATVAAATIIFRMAVIPGPGTD